MARISGVYSRKKTYGDVWLVKSNRYLHIQFSNFWSNIFFSKKLTHKYSSSSLPFRGSKIVSFYNTGGPLITRFLLRCIQTFKYINVYVHIKKFICKLSVSLSVKINQNMYIGRYFSRSKRSKSQKLDTWQSLNNPFMGK